MNLIANRQNKGLISPLQKYPTLDMGGMGGEYYRCDFDYFLTFLSYTLISPKKGLKMRISKDAIVREAIVDTLSLLAVVALVALF